MKLKQNARCLEKNVVSIIMALEQSRFPIKTAQVKVQTIKRKFITREVTAFENH